MAGSEPVWELTFHLEDGSELTCLEEARSGAEAYHQITSAWGPPSPIINFDVTRKRYFQIHIPSLEASVREQADAERRRAARSAARDPFAAER